MSGLPEKSPATEVSASASKMPTTLNGRPWTYSVRSMGSTPKKKVSIISWSIRQQKCMPFMSSMFSARPRVTLSGLTENQ